MTELTTPRAQIIRKSEIYEGKTNSQALGMPYPFSLVLDAFLLQKILPFWPKTRLFNNFRKTTSPWANTMRGRFCL